MIYWCLSINHQIGTGSLIQAQVRLKFPNFALLLSCLLVYNDVHQKISQLKWLIHLILWFICAAVILLSHYFWGNPVSLPSPQTEKPRGEMKNSILTLLIFMYTHFEERFLKMNNHRRKGHRCAKVVHYGCGIIAFLTLVPIVMKSRQFPTLNDRLSHGSITQVRLPRLLGVGEWWAGVNWLLLKPWLSQVFA